MSAEFSGKGKKIANSQFVKTCKWKITAEKRNLALWSTMRSPINRGWRRGVILGRDSKAFSTAVVRNTKAPELLRFRPFALYEQRLETQKLASCYVFDPSRFTNSSWLLREETCSVIVAELRSVMFPSGNISTIMLQRLFCCRWMG